jgi:hypothetical protein
MALMIATMPDVGQVVRERLDDGVADEVYGQGYAMSLAGVVAYVPAHPRDDVANVCD